MNKLLAWVLAILLGAICPLLALAAPPKMPPTTPPELLLVYWSSRDCRWCAAWESPTPGMENSLKNAKEFRKITYRVVKNERLADAYRDGDFAPDIKWLKERMDRGEEGHIARPSWSLYVNKIRVATFYGTKEWDSKNLPGIKQMINRYATGKQAIIAQPAPPSAETQGERVF